MYLIRNKENGVTYRSKSPCTEDKVSILSWEFFHRTLIHGKMLSENLWSSGEERITDVLNVVLEVSRVDGRKKEYKNLPYFTWLFLLGE
jgi:hypothetical protein